MNRLSKQDKLGILKKVLVSVLPARQKSISHLAMLDVGNFDDVRFNKNKFYSVISNPQSVFFKLSSFKFLYLWMLKGVVELTELFNLFNNLTMNLKRQAMEFFFSSRMEKVFEHKENNYLLSLLSRALNLLSTSFQGIQDFFRSASLTLRSVSRIASGLDHSIKSIISSNNSLEITLLGANTPRRFFSSMMIKGNFAIQDNDNKKENNMSISQFSMTNFQSIFNGSIIKRRN
jgi:hypothetical protein